MEEIKKVAFITLGCKVNQYETNGMAQKLKESGYEIVDHNEKADIYIINTCTVTNMVSKDHSKLQCKQFSESRSLIWQLKHQKIPGSNLRVREGKCRSIYS